MNDSKYYQYLFISAAIWNCVAALAVVFFDVQIKHISGLPPSNDPLMGKLFAATVFAFGIGYYIVSRNLTINRGIVLIGIIGKVLVFCISCIYFFLGLGSIVFALATFIDFVYAILFIRFLRVTQA